MKAVKAFLLILVAAAVLAVLRQRFDGATFTEVADEAI
jgi:hypothetical protein